MPINRYNSYGGKFSDTNDPRDQMQQNRMKWAGEGDTLLDQTSQNATDYGEKENRYQGQADKAYGDLLTTPGYNPEEAGQINKDYGQYRTSTNDLNNRQLTDQERADITGNPQMQRAALDPGYLEDIDRASATGQTTATAGMRHDLGAAYDPNSLRVSGGYGDKVQGALDSQQSGVGGALDTEQSKLDQAVDPNKLGLSGDFKGRYRMNDKDVQDLETQAGTSVGNRYQGAEDSLLRDAAAEGNTSPAAIAAARSRLLNQSAAGEGDAMTNARIAARHEQAGREKDIEGMRLGAEGDISSREMNAATAMGGQRTAAEENLAGRRLTSADTGEKMRMGGEQDIANRNTEAAVIGGQADINTQRRIGEQAQDTARYNQGARVNVERDIDKEQANRAGTLATNRQATTKDIGDTEYGQGMATGKATSEGAQTVGTARQKGEQGYRDYTTGQQTQAQQGKLASTGQQISGYGTQGQLVNQSTGQKGAQDLGQSSANQGWVKTVGGIASSFLEDGDVVTKPGIYTIGEHGPEAVVPVGDDNAGGTFVSPGEDRSEANIYGMAAGGSRQGPSMMQRLGAGIQHYRNRARQHMPMMADGGVVDKPTVVMLGEEGPEAVVPLDNPNAKITPSMIESIRKPSRYRSASCS